MRVDVDEARRDDQPSGIKGFARGARDLTDLDDPATSATRSGTPVPSMILPPRMTMS